MGERRRFYEEGWELVADERFARIKQRDPFERKFVVDLKVKFRSLFSPYHFESLLDVGCGDGADAEELGRICGARYIAGTDIAEKAVELARLRGIDAYCIDAESQPLRFGDDSFDAVVCQEVIEHLFDTDYMLKEIQRVLKPLGILFIPTPNLASWYNRAILLTGRQPAFTEVSLFYNVGKPRTKATGYHSLSGHIRIFTLRSMRELLQLHGFRIIKETGYRNDSEGLPKILSYMDRLLSLYPALASGFIVEAQKEGVFR